MLEVTHPSQHSHSFHRPESSLGLNEVRQEFQALYQRAPLRAIKVFFYYLTTRGVDQAAHEMAFWATTGSMYISVLLEHDSLNQESVPHDAAYVAMSLLPIVDPQFLIKLARAADVLVQPAAVLHTLQLVPSLGDYSILVPWLRKLESHKDSRIRSRSAKLLVQLRPSAVLLQHHLQSADARIRASIIEALWNPKISRADQIVLTTFRTGIDDPNHRVVANALVGLYRMGDTAALDKMIHLCTTKQHLLRAAMAWAMGLTDDSRAVPSLQRLTRDPSFTVRKRANDSLLALGYDPADLAVQCEPTMVVAAF